MNISEIKDTVVRLTTELEETEHEIRELHDLTYEVSKRITKCSEKHMRVYKEIEQLNTILRMYEILGSTK